MHPFRKRVAYREQLQDDPRIKKLAELTTWSIPKCEETVVALWIYADTHWPGDIRRNCEEWYDFAEGTDLINCQSELNSFMCEVGFWEELPITDTCDPYRLVRIPNAVETEDE